MAKRVLILSASSGAGHIRAAQALESAFRQRDDVREIVHVDTLQYTSAIFRNFYSRAYIDMVNNRPEVLGWLYDAFDRPWHNEQRRLAFDKLNARPFIKLFKETAPDIAVCTHFLPAEIISWLKAKQSVSCPQAITVTDFDVHAMWLCRYYEQYFVALPETGIHMAKLGIAEDKISVTGIPIDPQFAVSRDKAELRRQFGLDAHKTTILVSAGGFGVGPISNLFTSLLELEHPAQVMIMCGRNEQLKKKIHAQSLSLPADFPVKVHAVGFTDKMYEYMQASDILVGKPGGLTTSEALASGLVMVIVNPIPGQEERNSDHLLEEGAAIRCNNLPVLAYKIDRLIDDRSRFLEMQKNVARLAHPRAAYDIADQVMTLQPQAIAQKIKRPPLRMRKLRFALRKRPAL